MNKQIENESVEQHRINRINTLLDRLDRIPAELDTISEKLYSKGLTRNEFIKLVDQRRALYIEQENKERELKQVYKIKNK